MKKINLLVIFGGVSVEHDVSILTAMQIMKALDTSKYTIFPIYIAQSGIWKYNSNYTSIENLQKEKSKEVWLQPACRTLYKRGLRNQIANIDCALLCTHGTNVEDGVLQGVLESCGIPYTSSKVASSALTMDKEFMKIIFESSNFPIIEYLSIKDYEYFDEVEESLNKLETLSYPLIIKPARLGSSIAINVAKNRRELQTHIETAFHYDTKVIVEKALSDAIDLNCSVFRNRGIIEATQIEKPIKNKSILDFQTKYVTKNKLSADENKDSVKLGMSNCKREFPAQIDKSMSKKIQELSISAYKIFECSGIVRIDFLSDSEDNIFINEINSIPGSLSMYLWNNYESATLLDDLVISAIMEKEKSKSIIKTFDSNLLK